MKNWILDFFKTRKKSRADSPINNRSVIQKFHYQIEKKSLPLGESFYNNVVSDYYYVDKTLLIKDLIDDKTKITLFTRPRRFGKTLNMYMLKSFFEISDSDTSYLFADKKIWKEGEKYRQHQGKYPVIFISFKDIKNDNWLDALSNISSVISDEYIRHSELMASNLISVEEKKLYERIASKSSSEVECSLSLLKLSIMLDKHYGIPPIIIIDEYDTPIQQGYVAGYYDKVINFMRMFFSSAFKDNIHIKFGWMTGILKISKENIFSGLNNILVDTVLDSKYCQYFGFTEDEVQNMACSYLSVAKMDEIRNWYDGYRFGNTDIYNPWSVLNYFYYDCSPRAYWLNTSSNDIINEIINVLDETNYKTLLDLLQGNTAKSYIDTNFVYWNRTDSQEIPKLDVLLSFLLMTGYLKAVNTTLTDDGKRICELSIPNKEIKQVYRSEIIARKINSIRHYISTDIQDALRSGNSEELKSKLEELLIGSVSYYDTAKESFFHGLFIGICAVMNPYYEITSNRESGEGRYDIVMKPKIPNCPGIVIELKATNHIEKLKDIARDALEQIENKKYDIIFKSLATDLILKYGVAFCGKKAEIELKQTDTRLELKLTGQGEKIKTF